MPCSCWWNRDIPSQARQSEVDPGLRTNTSKIPPRTMHTAWQCNPDFPLPSKKELPASNPTLTHYRRDGLCTYISLPSIVPVQQSNPADDTSENPVAVDCCLSWSLVGYAFANAKYLLIASATNQTLSIVSVFHKLSWCHTHAHQQQWYRQVRHPVKFVNSNSASGCLSCHMQHKWMDKATQEQDAWTVGRR